MILALKDLHSLLVETSLPQIGLAIRVVKFSVAKIIPRETAEPDDNLHSSYCGIVSFPNRSNTHRKAFTWMNLNIHGFFRYFHCAFVNRIRIFQIKYTIQFGSHTLSLMQSLDIIRMILLTHGTLIWKGNSLGLSYRMLCILYRCRKKRKEHTCVIVEPSEHTKPWYRIPTVAIIMLLV